MRGGVSRLTESNAHRSSGVFEVDHRFTNSENVAGALTCGLDARSEEAGCASDAGAVEGFTSRVGKSLLSPLGRKMPPPTLLGRLLSRVSLASLNEDG